MALNYSISQKLTPFHTQGSPVYSFKILTMLQDIINVFANVTGIPCLEQSIMSISMSCALCKVCSEVSDHSEPICTKWDLDQH